MGKEGVRVDRVSGRGSDRGRRPARSAKRSANRDEFAGERRGLIQLAVSLALFLLVYIGRGVFPAMFTTWQAAASANVDFGAAFSRFGADLAQGEPVRGALETLWVTLLGKEPEETPVCPPEQPKSLTLLSDTPRGGLDYWRKHGLPAELFDGPQSDEPEPSEPVTASAEPEPTPVNLVTAMAQEYTDDGVKLPRNVSFAYYELGLSETCVPVAGAATSGFGYRDSPINGKEEFHLALDIGTEEGTEIGAFAAGTVEYIGQSNEFGNYLKISHENNVSSFYAHCSRLLVRKGDVVSCGQTVALVGHTGNATGPHLHLTIEKDNIRLDPAYYVDLS